MDAIAQVLNDIFDEIFLEWGARNSIVLRSRRELGTCGWDYLGRYVELLRLHSPGLSTPCGSIG